jgi:hypothetical protein
MTDQLNRTLHAFLLYAAIDREMEKPGIVHLANIDHVFFQDVQVRDLDFRRAIFQPIIPAPGHPISSNHQVPFLPARRAPRTLRKPHATFEDCVRHLTCPKDCQVQGGYILMQLTPFV